MWFSSWLRAGKRSEPAQRRRPRGSARQRAGLRPRLEVLEDRCLPSTLYVTSPLDDGSRGTLRYDIAHASSGDTIMMSPTLTTPIVLTQGELLLKKSVTIEGSPNQMETISGDGSSRVFEVAAGASVTLMNLNITGGNGVANNPGGSHGNDGFGGGVLNLGTLTVSSCALSGNSINHSYGEGGAIYTVGTLTVSNSTLSGNSVNGDGFGGDGGGIANNGGTVTVSNSTLSGSSAALWGGAIFNDAGGTVTVSNSTLSSSSAAQDGGAIYNVGTMTVSGCTLSGNFAAQDGGGILNRGTMTVSGCTLSGNSASWEGGGIDNYYGFMTVSGCTLSGNSAAQDGGGIYNVGNLTVSNSTLSSSSAAQDGGAIYNNGTLTVSGCTLSGNSAAQAGGAIYNNNFNALMVRVSDSIFSGNIPDNIYGPYTDDGGNTFG